MKYSNTIIFSVDDEYDGKQIKNFLRNKYGISAKMLTRLKNTKNGITLNGSHARVTKILSVGDVLAITMPEESNNEYIIPTKDTVPVIFENENFIVFDKPPYMPVHPVKKHFDDTLANSAAAYFRDKGEAFVFRAVNRLDRDTSGCVVCAKNPLYAFSLSGNIEKEYLAICQGDIYADGTIIAPIALKEGSSMVREVNLDGQEAITHYRVLKRNKGHTLLSIKLETGRTHQIRVHMSHIGHPLAGDDMYGGSRNYIKRQALHCSSITVNDSITDEIYQISAPLPEDFYYALKMLNIENCK